MMNEKTKKYFKIYTKDSQKGCTKWIEELHENIKKDYKYRIEHHNLNIEFEIIRIKKDLGEYESKTIGMSLELTMVMIGIIISVYFDKYFKNISSFKWLDNLLFFATVVIFGLLIFRGPVKSMIESNDKSFVNHIKIKVLNELKDSIVK